MNCGFQTWMKNTQSNKCKTCLYLALCIPKDELTSVVNLTSQVKRCKIELSILAYMPDGFKRCMSLCLDLIFLYILCNRCDAMLHFIPQLVEKKSFKSPKEFREESQWIFHNAIIYFGGNKEIYC